MTSVSLDNQVRDLIMRFKQVFDTHEGHLKSFCNHGVQLEGWIKGEFLSFLDQQKARGVIASFDREEKVSRDKKKKVDFKIGLITDTGTKYAWIELKHWLIGYQRGVRYDASFYFSDPTSVGISQDAKKLTNVPDEGRYILILGTANPGEDKWQKGVAKFNEKFAPINIETLIQPKGFPAYYCIGLVKVSELVR